MTAPKPPDAAPAPSPDLTGPGWENRRRTLTCEATEAEARELATAAAIEGMDRRPWFLQAALKVARQVNRDWAVARAAREDGEFPPLPLQEDDGA